MNHDHNLIWWWYLVILNFWNKNENSTGIYLDCAYSYVYTNVTKLYLNMDSNNKTHNVTINFKVYPMCEYTQLNANNKTFYFICVFVN